MFIFLIYRHYKTLKKESTEIKSNSLVSFANYLRQEMATEKLQSAILESLGDEAKMLY